MFPYDLESPWFVSRKSVRNNLPSRDSESPNGNAIKSKHGISMGSSRLRTKFESPLERSSSSFDFVYEIGRPEPWVPSRLPAFVSRLMSHFQRRHRPRRHWDEREKGRFPAVLPIYSRCDLAAYRFDNSLKE